MGCIPAHDSMVLRCDTIESMCKAKKLRQDVCAFLTKTGVYNKSTLTVKATQSRIVSARE